MRRRDDRSGGDVGVVGRFPRGARAFLFSICSVGSLSLLGLTALFGTLAGSAFGAGGAAAASSGAGSKVLTPTEQAEAMLLTRADLPVGWASPSDRERPTHTAPLSEPMAKCIGVSSSVATVKPLKVSGANFTAPGRAAAVENSASVYATTAQATAAFEAMANPKTPSCMGMLGAAPFQSSIQAETGRAATVDSISISPLPAGAAEPYQTGFTVTIPLSVEGKKLTIDSTQIDFRKGKVLQQLTFNGNGAPFPPLEQVHLLQIATGHP